MFMICKEILGLIKIKAQNLPLNFYSDISLGLPEEMMHMFAPFFLQSRSHDCKKRRQGYKVFLNLRD